MRGTAQRPSILKLMSDFTVLLSDVMAQCVQCFGTSALYTPVVGDSVSVSMIFSKEFSEYETEGQNIGGYVEYFGLRSDDLPFKPRSGDKITYNNKIYEVYRAQHDGRAGYKLYVTVFSNA